MRKVKSLYRLLVFDSLYHLSCTNYLKCDPLHTDPDWIRAFRRDDCPTSAIQIHWNGYARQALVEFLVAGGNQQGKPTLFSMYKVRCTTKYCLCQSHICEFFSDGPNENLYGLRCGVSKHGSLGECGEKQSRVSILKSCVLSWICL